MTEPCRNAMPIPPKPTEADWKLVKQIYDQACLLDKPKRSEFVGNMTLSEVVRTEVLSLLSHEPDQSESGSSFLSQPAAVQLLKNNDRSGTHLGAWEIVRTLGTGGMGDVFEARRADGNFEGRAAVKLLKRGMDSAAVLQRFAQERQALARLNHPNIATLFDAGLSKEGIPFFVMELVDGKSIDEAVIGLSLEQRLALFLQLVDAVAHAHRNLLVHRDLKPGNVLVTPQGVVKLLDFGIAKALDPLEDSLANENVTLGGVRPYTPNYASPEQIRGEPVTTFTDIYSLGVLLYQLLTGVRPTGRSATTPAEAARSVLEETPTRPSSLSTTQVPDPGWLDTRKRLRGDLDNILLKALEKPAERRYVSADAFGADIRAYLKGFPVSARRRSTGYVVMRFVARHRAAVTIGVLGIFAVVTGMVGTVWQAREAQISSTQARQRLADMRMVVHNLVFRFGDSVTYLPGGMNIKEALLIDTLSQLQRLADTTKEDLGILSDIATLHSRLALLQFEDTGPSLDRPEQARKHVGEAIALGTKVWAERRNDAQFVYWIANAYMTQARLLRSDGKHAQAVEATQSARAVVQESLQLQNHDDQRAMLLGPLADTLLLEAQMLDAPNLTSMNRPDDALLRLGEAEQVYRRLLAFDDKVFLQLDANRRPEDARSKASGLNDLATTLQARGLIRLQMDDPEGALPDMQAATQVQDEVLAIDPQQTPWHDGAGSKYNDLAITLLRLRRYSDALVAAKRAWDEANSLQSSPQPILRWKYQVAKYGQQYASSLAGLGRHAEAIVIFNQCLSLLTQRIKETPGSSRTTWQRLALMQTELSRAQSALGNRSVAVALSRQASSNFQTQADSGAVSRELLIGLGQALAWQAQIDPAQANDLRERARSAFERADAIHTLKADNAAAREELLRLI